MSRAKPIRLSDGRLVAPSRAKPLELREPLERAVRRCLVNGVPVEREGGRKFRIGWRPNCERPVAWLAYGARSEYVKGSRHPISVMGFGRCRKCEACLKARSQMWQIRAMYEYERWPVTLFGTVTLSPEEHYRHDAIIQQGTRGDDGRYIRHPANLDEMSPTEQFEARVGVFGDEMQRYFKRLRKGRKLAPGAIRYLLVAEAHDSERTDASIRGRPHFHLLIHECHPGVLVYGNPRDAFIHGESGEYRAAKYKAGGAWRTGVFASDDAFLRTQWQLGFTKFQFAENARAASYLCKYLTKASDSRIRASQKYGFEIEDEKKTGSATSPMKNMGEEIRPPFPLD